MPLARERLRAWLAAGHHGSMDLDGGGGPSGAPIRGRSGQRCAASSCSGSTTGRRAIRCEGLARRDRGTISVYARNRDYHDVVKGKLKQVAGFLASPAGADVKVFVDTAPVMEKPLAEAAGLGWQGKHTVLVSREFGNWLFLGAIFTDGGTAAGQARDGPLRLLPALPRHLPDERLPRALFSSMRDAASRI